MRQMVWPFLHEDWSIYLTSRVKTAPPPGANVSTKFYENWTNNKISRPFKENCPPPGSHVFQLTGTTRANQKQESLKDIIWTNLLTKFHEDQKINVASRVLTRFYYSHKPVRKNAPPSGSQVLQPTGIIF
ncbi:hypothetical protein DPMN_006295 [Dreissena polymorpha]|uniref:Uncharacterized protein n=1 Tax=Dreissena polymorpha TaxID=45954 RepID=A0A9D4RX96_DREPO|nr:hypothetical protein DPMN_006295 [Dreissena polymorpha]